MRGVLGSLLLSCAIAILAPSAENAPGKRALETLVETVRSPLDIARCEGRHPLCAVFLGHRDALPSDQRHAFQAAGLSHLIALSGGQTTPLAAALAGGFLAPLLFLGVFCYGAPGILFARSALAKLRILIYALTASFAAFLYGATGALLRVPFLSFVVSLLPRGLLFSSAFKRGLGLCALSFFLGNPFANASFLLSCLGCEALLFASHGAAALRSKRKSQAAFFVPEALFQLFAVTVLTSIIMTLALAGFAPQSPHNSGAQAIVNATNSALLSAQANLIAVPFVTWIITPLSFAELVSSAAQTNSPLSQFLSGLYDHALKTFELVAHAFSSGASNTTPQTHSPIRLFASLRTPGGSLPFALALAFFWGVRDFWDEKRNRTLNREFSNLKTTEAARQTPPQ